MVEPRVEDLQPPQEQQQEKKKFCEITDHKFDMDASFGFEGGSFDLGLLESTLMSSAMYRDLSSIDDFGWNF
ncbi:hypothetical protein F3Y22_tig00117032pilonHSYRG00298 [Hibiscus syriacus]|uniref:Uncharacterized protein n=1 Tax=Hibiscus syriacus TaxID=106335 RepID=A0A6A2XAM6_HIBSY|nr:hypothetical protein F3Y22_tig00117032pilonHSYRG00298 [Hibiscus syriacus]